MDKSTVELVEALMTVSSVSKIIAKKLMREGEEKSMQNADATIAQIRAFSLALSGLADALERKEDK